MLGFDVRPPEKCDLCIPATVTPQPRGAILQVSGVAFIPQADGNTRLVAIVFQSPSIARDRYGNQPSVSMEMTAQTARALAQYLYAAAQEADQIR